MLQFKLIHPKATQQMLGIIPSFLSASDPRTAQEQINENYKHGGGWRPFDGFTIKDKWLMPKTDDDPLPPMAEARLHSQTIIFYPGAWVAIINDGEGMASSDDKDEPGQYKGSFEVARID